jgi:hypothetical protein
MPRVRPGLVVVAAVATAAAAVGVAGSAVAQVTGSIMVAPAVADPGGMVVVTNGADSLCFPVPVGATSPSVSVDLYAAGSATPANRLPYLGGVSPLGAWSVEVRVAPDMPPGLYRVQAGCFTDSGLNAGFGPTYQPGRLNLRQQELGPPRPSSSVGRPGQVVQVGSGQAPCVPPAGSPSPRVRVSLLDGGRATRAEAEGAVDSATGAWSVTLTIPSVDPQDAQISAVCLARVGASVPYARYGSAAFAIDAVPLPPTTTTSSTVPGSITPSTTPGTTPPTSVQPLPAELPITPLATAIVAEPTYTG